MKRILGVLFFFLFVSKLVISQVWLTNFDQAKTEASEQDKPILLVFQGSDWCVPCIKMEKKIWHSEVFKSFAQAELVLLQADFPRRKKNVLPEPLQLQNAELAERYNKQGVFPFVVLMDNQGKVTGETGFEDMTADDYVTHLREILAL